MMEAWQRRGERYTFHRALHCNHSFGKTPGSDAQAAKNEEAQLHKPVKAWQGFSGTLLFRRFASRSKMGHVFFCHDHFAAERIELPRLANILFAC